VLAVDLVRSRPERVPDSLPGFLPWIKQIIMYKALNLSRRIAREHQLAKNYADLEQELQLHLAAKQVAEWEFEEMLERFSKYLDPLEKQMLVWYFRDNLPTRLISNRLGEQQAATRKRKQRMLEKLRAVAMKGKV